MKDTIIVERYAEAFISYAKETVGLPKAISDLKALRALIRENPEALEFLKSLDITFAEKEAFVDKVFEDELAIQTKQFLKLLIEKQRIDKIIDITDYVRIKYAYAGEEEVLLKTSYPLDLELIKRIEDRLEKKFSKKFKFYIDMDSSLLGGIQVIIGNTIIDGSVRHRLSELKEKLMAVGV